MNYSWSYKDLKKRYNMLQRKLKGNLSFKDRILIVKDMEETLTSISFLLLDYDDFGTPSMVDAVAAEHELLSYYSFLWRDCLEVADTIESKLSFKLRPQRLMLTQDELLGIVHDFYKNQIGGEFFLTFLKDFNQRYNHVRFTPSKNVEGATYHVGYFKESFIDISWNHIFLDIIVLIHEYGHAIHFQTNYYNQASMELLPFWEIVSMFMESVAYDHFIKDSTFSKMALESKLIDHKSLLNNMYDLGTLLKLFQNWDIEELNSNGRIKHCARIAGISIKDLMYSLNTQASCNLQYVVSFLVVIELMDVYRNDPEKAFYLLRQILSIKALDLDEYYRELVGKGINLHAHVKDFESELKRELKRF